MEIGIAVSVIPCPSVSYITAVQAGRDARYEQWINWWVGVEKIFCHLLYTINRKSRSECVMLAIYYSYHCGTHTDGTCVLRSYRNWYNATFYSPFMTVTKRAVWSNYGPMYGQCLAQSMVLCITQCSLFGSMYVQWIVQWLNVGLNVRFNEGLIVGCNV